MNITKRLFFIIIIVALTGAPLIAQPAWSTLGFTLQESDQQSENPLTSGTTLLKSSKGILVEIKHRSEITDAQAKRISELQKTFESWQYIKADRIRYNIEGSRIEINVNVETFSYQGTQAQDNLPSGMIFVATDSLQYGFRLAVNNMFIKIRGYYSNEKEVAEKISAAIKDPGSYLKTRDPEYMATRIERLDQKLTALEANQKKIQAAVIGLHNTGFFSGPEQVTWQKINHVLEAKKSNPALNAENIQQQIEKKGIEISEKEVELILIVFYNQF